MKTHSSRNSRKKAKHGAAARSAVSPRGQTKRLRRRRRGDSSSAASTPSPRPQKGSDAAVSPSRSSGDVRCAIYVRSAHSDSNVAAQIEQCARLIAERFSSGWQVDRVYIDRGYSGLDLDRPGFAKLVEEAKTGEFTTVVVSNVDRLGRGVPVVMHAIESLRTLGVGAYAVREGEISKNDSSAAEKIARLMMVAVAEAERGKLTERTRHAARTRAQIGLWPGGTPPYGYDYDLASRTLRENRSEVGDVRLMFTQLAAGRSLPDVRDELRVRVSRMRRRTKGANDKQSGRMVRLFTCADVRRIVANPVYRGVVRVRDHGAVGDSGAAQDAYLEFAGRHTPVVSDAVWNAANAAIT